VPDLRGQLPGRSRSVFAPLDWQPDKRTSLEPDLLVVAQDRIGEKNITENPAIVVEVLSPSTSRYDRVLQFPDTPRPAFRSTGSSIRAHHRSRRSTSTPTATTS
jgi:hypothetical protein